MMSVSVLNTEDRTANAPFYFNGRRQTIKNISEYVLLQELITG